jgi:hypothetical protein
LWTGEPDDFIKFTVVTKLMAENVAKLIRPRLEDETGRKGYGGEQ